MLNIDRAVNLNIALGDIVGVFRNAKGDWVLGFWLQFIVTFFILTLILAEQGNLTKKSWKQITAATDCSIAASVIRCIVTGMCFSWNPFRDDKFETNNCSHRLRPLTLSKHYSMHTTMYCSSYYKGIYYHCGLLL